MNHDAQKHWKLDPAHTTVGFSIRHLMIANVRGVFETIEGTVSYDSARPEAAQLDVKIAVASVHTREPQRDQHLRSADFFDAERYPTIRFRGTGLRRRADGALELDGALTIRDATRPITLQIDELTAEQRDFQGARRFGASARGKLRRSDFGITFNKLLETGGVGIGDDVLLTIDASIVEVITPVE